MASADGAQLGEVDQAVHGVGRRFDEDHGDAAFGKCCFGRGADGGGVDAVGKAFR